MARSSGGLVLLVALMLPGCAGLALQESVAVATGGIGLTTVFAGRSPNNEIEQTYYLGVFDPQDQLPPTVYRVRVRGQASAMSGVKFASGWVPANVLDALGTSMAFEKDSNRVKIDKDDSASATFKTGRRLMLFGPEGFREAPAHHRLVVMMGSSPDKFFQAIDESLGVVAQATQERGSVQLDRFLFETLVRVRSERTELDRLVRDINADLPMETR
jgi:hypothetical protein